MVGRANSRASSVFGLTSTAACTSVMSDRISATVIFRSPHPDVPIPDVPYSSFILRHERDRADRPVLVDGPSGRTLTQGQVAGGARRMAAGLARRGFTKRDVVAICSPNLPEYALAFHGPLMIGGIVTTTNPLYTPEELGFQLRDTGAKYLITIPLFLDKAREAARGTSVREIFVFGDTPPDNAGATPFAALLDNDGDPPAVTIDPRNDLAVLPYSSGTSGPPNGAVLTQRNPGAVAPPGRGAGADRRDLAHARHPALLPHLRPGGAHELPALSGRALRHHAPLRSGGVSEAHPGISADASLPGAADRARAGQASAGGSVRPVFPEARRVRRGASRRGVTAGVRRASRVSRHARLRDDRDEPRLSHDASGSGPGAARLRRADADEHGIEDHRRRDGRRATGG